MARKTTKVAPKSVLAPPLKESLPPGKNTNIERRQAHLIHDPLRVVFSTATADEAEVLARKLLEERLVACVNLLPGVTSFYRWKGKLERSAETLVVMKTPASKINLLRQRLRALHSYTVPEFLALQVMEVNPAYATWAAEETRIEQV